MFDWFNVFDSYNFLHGFSSFHYNYTLIVWNNGIRKSIDYGIGRQTLYHMVYRCNLLLLNIDLQKHVSVYLKSSTY